MKRFVLVALTTEGEELRRLTVDEPKLERAKEVLLGFADWVDVFELNDDGTLRLSARKGTRP